MSGILASSVIQTNGACKLYTNSSGNPAAVTIHAAVPSTTDNACLSIKVSSTDACICTDTVQSTADVPVNDNIAIVYDSGYNFDGYTCWQNGTCKSMLTMAFVDSGGTCHSYVDSPSVRSRMCYGSPYTSSGNRPTSDTYFGVCAFCCPRGEICHQSHCCYTLNAILNRYVPNFHTSTSGERHVSIPIACCNLSNCYPKWAWINFNHHDGTNCCFIEAACAELKYETHLDVFDCASTNKPSGSTNGFRPDWMQNCMGWYVTDLWSCYGTTVWQEQLNPPGSCDNYRVGANLRICCQQAIYYMQDYNLYQCCISQMVHPNYFRSVALECCYCCACCCNAQDTEMLAAYPARKPVMLGCDFAILQNVGSSNCFIFQGYGYDCLTTSFNANCHVYGFQPMWYALGRYACDSCYCYSCCVRTFQVGDVGMGAVKWTWYNPYIDCNYIAIIDGSSCAYSGIYSFEIDCIGKDGYICCSHTSCLNVSKYFKDWISDEWFLKVADLPSDWERFTCLCAQGGCYTFMSNPVLVGECCWAVWAQCFNWGDTSLDSVGWNGCMLRYGSNDLANWTLTTDEVSLSVTAGSGETECIVGLKNDGANFSRSVNHYFNATNCVDNAGTLEYKTQANRLERTGIVLSNGSSIYVNNSGSPVGLTIWGYDE